MNTFVIEALPSNSFRIFPVALEKLLTVIDCKIVFARHIEDLFRLSSS